METLTANERSTLRAVCAAFVPAVETSGDVPAEVARFNAEAARTAERYEKHVATFLGPAAVGRLKKLLGSLDSSWVNLLLAGRWRRVSNGSLAQQQDLLRAWGTSPWPIARSGFMALKRLALFLTYTSADDQPHPLWSHWNYHPPQPLATSPAQLKMLSLQGETSLQTDVLIIGSGAGGSVMAAELAAAGSDVLVIDQGAPASDADLGRGEAVGMKQFYERAGSLTTEDQSMVILAGNGVGGGTTVNWMTCLPPPDAIRREWADHGFTGADGSSFSESISFVQQRLGVSQPPTENRQNQLLAAGCEKLGLKTHHLFRNAGDCSDCSFCGYGCPMGGKRDARRTFLADAQTHGARILPRTQATQITIRGGVAVGAEAVHQTANGQSRTIQINCKKVVLAGGALHTPQLLIRSGLSNPNIGRNLHLHPTTATFALYDEPVRSWEGVPQSRLCDDFAFLDGKNYGFRLETAPAHPGLWASSLPWDSAESHKSLMSQLEHLANIIVLTRDQFSGEVIVKPNQPPGVRYSLRGVDCYHLMKGVYESLGVHRAASARRVFAPCFPNLAFETGDDQAFEEFRLQVMSRGYRPNSIGLYSAHQLSSCRIGDSPKTGAVKPTGETFEVGNLYVADGSVLPTASGVNPMVSIMASARFLAQQMV